MVWFSSVQFNRGLLSGSVLHSGDPALEELRVSDRSLIESCFFSSSSLPRIWLASEMVLYPWCDYLVLVSSWKCVLQILLGDTPNRPPASI